jgi:hypothetical protein
MNQVVPDFEETRDVPNATGGFKAFQTALASI